MPALFRLGDKLGFVGVLTERAKYNARVGGDDSAPRL